MGSVDVFSRAATLTWPEHAPVIGIMDGVRQALGRVRLPKGAEVTVVDRWRRIVHIDETLPLVEKEKLMLPIFPWAVEQLRGKATTVGAINEVAKELAFHNPLTVNDLRRWQRWIYDYGVYNGSEGRYAGEDRFRAISKLVNDRRIPYPRQEGKTLIPSGKFGYDCDDHGISTCQILDHYGMPYRFVLISQRPIEPDEGLSPLHHVLPAFWFDGAWWLLEGIPLKDLPRIPPIVKVSDADLLFGPHLQRVALIHPDSRVEEYAGWGFRPMRYSRHEEVGGLQMFNRWS